MSLFKIDNNSSTPKYRQIVQSVIDSIDLGQLKKEDQLPSINEVSEEYYLSRDTVEKAYAELRSKGIIKSVPGKGYFINKTDISERVKIFLLFNKLSDYKKIIWDAFVNTIGEKGNVDLFIYNNDQKKFKEFVNESLGKYNYYVIISHFTDPAADVSAVLNQIPEGKLILLDKDIEGISHKQYSSVYQNFEKDIFLALEGLSDLLEKYQEMVLVFPNGSYHPAGIKGGFIRFCGSNSIRYRIDTGVEFIKRGEAYVILEENDLVQFLKQVKAKNLKIGEEVGIISYNEDPLKELLFDGLTVISTDFKSMGAKAASLILDKSFAKAENPFAVIRRNSL
ncbi:MAG: GntR family transcriptional regulator [Cytophagaceae bacterium]